MNLKALTLLPSLLIVGCGSDESLIINETEATGFSYTLASKPAVSISVKQDENNFCEITMFRSNVRAGYCATLSQKATGELSSSCYWDGDYFIQSSKHPTIASLSISEVNDSTQIATFNINLKLVNNKSFDDYFELKDAQFTLSGQQYVNLVTMPKS